MDALLVALGWLVASALFVGLGGLVAPLVVDRSRPFASWTRLFWSGFCLALLALQLWHFALPVDGRAWLLLGPAALAGFWRLSKRPPQWPGLRIAALVATGVLLVWVALRALLPPNNPDTCLYYLATSRWFSAYPIVPGLGNLHHRLAFNHSFFLYLSFLDVGPFKHRAEHLAGGLLLLWVAVPGLLSTLRLCKRSDYLWALIFGVTLDEILRGGLSNPSADIAVWALSGVIGSTVAETILDGEEVDSERLRFVSLLAMTSLTMKPTALFVALPFALFELVRAKSKTPLWILSICALALVPWAARGIVMSGYPFFPSTSLNLHLPWRVPEAIARDALLYAQAFARSRAKVDYTGGDYPWMGHWLELEWVENRSFLIPFATLAIATLLLIILSIRARRRPPESGLLLAGAASLLLWWFLAPATRFLGPLHWLLAAIAVLSLSIPRPALIALLLLVDIGAFIGSGNVIVAPRGFMPPPPESYRVVRLASGDEIHEDQGCCIEVPCGLDVGKLRMRQPGDPGAGFESLSLK